MVKDKTKPLNRTKCDICGYQNGNEYVKFSGVCHLCGNILDKQAYFKAQLNKKMRLWRGDKFRKWN